MKTAKDGKSNYIKNDLPCSKQKQSSLGASSIKKAKEKLKKVLDRGYISLVYEVR